MLLRKDGVAQCNSGRATLSTGLRSEHGVDGGGEHSMWPCHSLTGDGGRRGRCEVCRSKACVGPRPSRVHAGTGRFDLGNRALEESPPVLRGSRHRFARSLHSVVSEGALSSVFLTPCSHVHCLLR